MWNYNVVSSPDFMECCMITKKKFFSTHSWLWGKHLETILKLAPLSWRNFIGLSIFQRDMKCFSPNVFSPSHAVFVVCWKEIFGIILIDAIKIEKSSICATNVRLLAHSMIVLRAVWGHLFVRRKGSPWSEVTCWQGVVRLVESSHPCGKNTTHKTKCWIYEETKKTSFFNSFLFSLSLVLLQKRRK